MEPDHAPRAAHPVIDRAQFLLITAALAAANGCGGASANTPAAPAEGAGGQVVIPGAIPRPAASDGSGADAKGANGANGANGGPDYGRVGGVAGNFVPFQVVLAPVSVTLRTLGLFGSVEGLRFDIDAQTQDGLNIDGTALAVMNKGAFHLVLFLAPEEHYFGASKARVETILSSAKVN